MIKPHNMKTPKASTFSGREAFELVEVKIVSLTSEQHILDASPEPVESVGGLTLYHDGGVF